MGGMSSLTSKKEALAYHSQGRPGKIEVVPTKPTVTQIDLSLAYSPGVAEPCREIAADPSKVFEYTARGNLVAVVTDGSAVLGLGNIGPLAAKPVMEGKGVLFKRFADIDVFDIELGTQDTEEIIAAIKAISPTVAGINLEDISAPRCFEIERRLSEELDIPVFHDDQHGTAMITGAALINAVEVAQKSIEDLRVVVNGAGAAAIACANFVISLGVQRERLMMCDSKGVIHTGRTDVNEYKAAFAVETDARSLADAMVGSDVFIGVSVGNVVTPEMLNSMTENPIVFAMANPDPEIDYELAMETRSDVIMATGRSDHPNQVNNVLGFPFLFRGALDVRATGINTEMLHAASRALAELAREAVPSSVARAYGKGSLVFGREYLIPKPLDSRVLPRAATAVARAAMESGVARKRIDLDSYEREVAERLGPERDIMRRVVSRARRNPGRIVYPEGSHAKTLLAAQAIAREGIARPILVGDRAEIEKSAEEVGVDLTPLEIVDPSTWPRLAEYEAKLIQLRSHRRHLTPELARERVLDPVWFSALMVAIGDADGMVAGATRNVRKTMPPIMKVIPKRPGASIAAGVSMLITNQGALFLADTALNIEPSSEDLAEIASLAADLVRRLGIEPVVAMLSFSSFGGSQHPRSDAVRRAVEIAREEDPSLIIDGEMRVDAALDPVVQARYEECRLGGRRANVLVFPNLEAANIGFNLVRMLTAESTMIGPMMVGLDKPVIAMQPHSAGVEDIIHLTAMASIEAHDNRKRDAALETAAEV